MQRDLKPNSKKTSSLSLLWILKVISVLNTMYNNLI